MEEVLESWEKLEGKKNKNKSGMAKALEGMDGLNTHMLT